MTTDAFHGLWNYPSKNCTTYKMRALWCPWPVWHRPPGARVDPHQGEPQRCGGRFAGVHRDARHCQAVNRHVRPKVAPPRWQCPQGFAKGGTQALQNKLGEGKVCSARLKNWADYHLIWTLVPAETKPRLILFNVLPIEINHFINCGPHLIFVSVVWKKKDCQFQAELWTPLLPLPSKVQHGFKRGGLNPWAVDMHLATTNLALHK